MPVHGVLGDRLGVLRCGGLLCSQLRLFVQAGLQGFARASLTVGEGGVGVGTGLSVVHTVSELRVGVLKLLDALVLGLHALLQGCDLRLKQQ